MKNNIELTNERLVYIDYLRIIATIAVVFLHVAAQNYYTLNIDSLEWNVLNAYAGSVRWCVPIFVMISGALFLKKQQTIGIIFKKNITRLIVAFVFWSVLYALYELRITHSISSFHELVYNSIIGHYHMWFIYMIIGLYLVVPILYRIVQNTRTACYFLMLALIFAFIIPQATSLISIKNTSVAELINEVINNFNLHLVIGYTGYFVLGYILNEANISKKQEYIIYAFAIFGIVFTIVATFLFSKSTGTASTFFYDYIQINTLLPGIGVFVFFKKHLNRSIPSHYLNKKLTFLSNCCFGVYLIHPLIISIIEKYLGINTLMLSPIVSVPLITVLVFALSLVISIIINRIPLLKNWIV